MCEMQMSTKTLDLGGVRAGMHHGHSGQTSEVEQSQKRGPHVEMMAGWVDEAMTGLSLPPTFWWPTANLVTNHESSVRRCGNEMVATMLCIWGRCCQ
jgi:hypothetical protein